MIFCEDMHNVYTNVVAGLAIEFAKYAECVASCHPVPEEWMEIANKLTINYDSTQDFHPEYEGYG